MNILVMSLQFDDDSVIVSYGDADQPEGDVIITNQVMVGASERWAPRIAELHNAVADFILEAIHGQDEADDGAFMSD